MADPAATERAHAAAMAAFAARPAGAGAERARLRRRRRGARALLAAAVVAALGAVVLSPAGARVGDWLGRALDPPSSRPATVLPGPGPLLLSGRDGSWTLDRALRPTQLGEFGEAAWSARGNFTLLNRGDALFARDRDGRTRWTLARPAINRPAWSRGDGFRVAYRSGRQLRIVAGDGSGDRLLAIRSAAVTPAWQPGLPARHALAWATAGGAVLLADVDASASAAPRVLLPAAAARVTALAWVGPHRLLVLRGGGLVLLDERGRVHARLPKPDRGRFTALTSAPAARTAAFVRRAPHGTSVVWSVRFGADPTPAARPRAADRGPTLLGGARARIAFAGSGGTIRSLALAPDGRWLAFVWPPSDQLLMQRLAGRPRLLTVDRLAARLGHLGGSSGTTVVGWAP